MKDQRINGYTLSNRRWRFRAHEVMALLALTYWAKDRDRKTVTRCLRHSVPYGVFSPQGKLVGFLRVTTDRSTVFYLADVVVADAERGKGLGIALVQFALADARNCQGKGLLLTQTANGLYEKVGFYNVSDRLMIRDPVKPGA